MTVFSIEAEKFLVLFYTVFMLSCTRMCCLEFEGILFFSSEYHLACVLLCSGFHFVLRLKKVWARFLAIRYRAAFCTSFREYPESAGGSKEKGF